MIDQFVFYGQFETTTHLSQFLDSLILTSLAVVTTKPAVSESRIDYFVVNFVHCM